MKNYLPLLALLTFAGVCAFAGISADAQPLAPSSPPRAQRAPVDEPVTDAPPDMNVVSLAMRLVDAAHTWPEASLPHADLAAVAYDVALAVSWSREPTCPVPMNDGPHRMTDTPESRGVLALALGWWEGARFASYVDDGRCNDRAWRASPEGRRTIHVGGHCDGGLAFSFWQVHLDGGLLAFDPEGVTPEKMKYTAYAASIGLSMVCRSLARTGSLVDYTGESASFHPKADERLDFARRFIPRELPQE